MAYGLAAVDLNKDGNTDIAITCATCAGVSILAGNGLGSFGPQVTSPTVGVAFYMASGDFDSDGRPDLVVTNPSDSNVSVFFNATVDNGNRAPVADAGMDQTLECIGPGGAPVTLDGSASADPDGDKISYVWRDSNQRLVGTSAVIQLAGAQATPTFSLTVTDTAGASSTVNTHVTIRDTRPPILTLSTKGLMMPLPTASVPGARIDLSQYVTATATDLCGGASISNDAPALFPMGKTVVTYTATDRSGNTAQERLLVQIVYKFAGFSAPISLGLWNTIQGGRTVPIKWQLMAADGTFVSDLRAVTSIWPELTTCVVGSPRSAPQGDAAGVKFDPATRQYIYVWPTVKSWSGSCRYVNFLLKDGNVWRASFVVK
jgi:hypothetical protein